MTVNPWLLLAQLAQAAPPSPLTASPQMPPSGAAATAVGVWLLAIIALHGVGALGLVSARASRWIHGLCGSLAFGTSALLYMGSPLGQPPETSAEAAQWCIAAALVMFAASRFQTKPSKTTNGALWGVSALLLGGAALALTPIRPALPTILSLPQANLLGFCAVGAMGGALGANLLALWSASQDRRLQSQSWLVSGGLLVCGAAALYAPMFPLTDAEGAPLSALVTVLTLSGGEPQSIHAFSWITQATLPPGLIASAPIILAVLAALGAALGAAKRTLGLIPMLLASAVAATLGLWMLLALPGAYPLPTTESLTETSQHLGAGIDLLAQLPDTTAGAVSQADALAVASRQGLDGEQLLHAPALSATSAQVQRADALGPALLCFLLALVALHRGLTQPPPQDLERPGPNTWPHSLHTFEGRLQPGTALLTARDAMQLCALLLWTAVALSLLLGFEATARYTLQPHQGLWLAAAVAASASVWGWHRATHQAEHEDFTLWLTLPMLTLLLALLAVVLGAGDQLPALRLLP